MNNKNKPEIRFKEFNDDWKEYKLSELGTIMTGNTPSTNNKNFYDEKGLLWVTPTDITQNIVGDTERKLSSLGEKVARIAPENSLLITCIASIGKNALIYEKAGFNQQINSLTPFNGQHNVYFLLTDSFNWSNLMKKIAGKLTLQIINKAAFSEIITKIPAQKEEEDKIGEYFKLIDNLIKLQEVKFEKLIELKTAFLEKIFPEGKSNKPKIRFNTFTNPWKNCKLNDFGIATGGTSIESDFYENGIYKVISIGSYSEQSKYNDQGIRAVYSNKTKNKILNKGDLTMILNDKSSLGKIIGRVLLIDKSNEYVYNQRTERIEINTQKYDSDFLYHLLNAPNIRSRIIRQSQGNTQIFVNWNSIKNTEYYIPSKEEQLKISILFNSIDNLITLHQQKLEKLKNIREAMMQKMLI